MLKLALVLAVTVVAVTTRPWRGSDHGVFQAVQDDDDNGGRDVGCNSLWKCLVSIDDHADSHGGDYDQGRLSPSQNRHQNREYMDYDDDIYESNHVNRVPRYNSEDSNERHSDGDVTSDEYGRVRSRRSTDSNDDDNNSTYWDYPVVIEGGSGNGRRRGPGSVNRVLSYNSEDSNERHSDGDVTSDEYGRVRSRRSTDSNDDDNNSNYWDYPVVIEGGSGNGRRRGPGSVNRVLSYNSEDSNERHSDGDVTSDEYGRVRSRRSTDSNDDDNNSTYWDYPVVIEGGSGNGRRRGPGSVNRVLSYNSEDSNERHSDGDVTSDEYGRVRSRRSTDSNDDDNNSTYWDYPVVIEGGSGNGRRRGPGSVNRVLSYNSEDSNERHSDGDVTSDEYGRVRSRRSTDSNDDDNNSTYWDYPVVIEGGSGNGRRRGPGSVNRVLSYNSEDSNERHSDGDVTSDEYGRVRSRRSTDSNDDDNNSTYWDYPVVIEGGSGNGRRRGPGSVNRVLSYNSEDSNERHSDGDVTSDEYGRVRSRRSTDSNDDDNNSTYWDYPVVIEGGSGNGRRRGPGSVNRVLSYNSEDSNERHSDGDVTSDEYGRVRSRRSTDSNDDDNNSTYWDYPVVIEGGSGNGRKRGPGSVNRVLSYNSEDSNERHSDGDVTSDEYGRVRSRRSTDSNDDDNNSTYWDYPVVIEGGSDNDDYNYDINNEYDRVRRRRSADSDESSSSESSSDESSSEDRDSRSRRSRRRHRQRSNDNNNNNIYDDDSNELVSRRLVRRRRPGLNSISRDYDNYLEDIIGSYLSWQNRRRGQRYGGDSDSGNDSREER